MPNRRQLLIAIAAAAAAGRTSVFAQAQSPLVEIWKDPNCGCCKDWAAHLEANGFRVKVNETSNVAAVRERLGIHAKFGSCHTALVGGYALEGHVPARDIRRLLKEKPSAIGLAVPGMPVGSPGMDGPVYAGRKDPYDVLLLAGGTDSKVFQAYR